MIKYCKTAHYNLNKLNFDSPGKKQFEKKKGHKKRHKYNMYNSVWEGIKNITRKLLPWSQGVVPICNINKNPFITPNSLKVKKQIYIIFKK